MQKKTLRIGCGAGMADDRIAPAVPLVERGKLDYLVMECLAERTIARETQDRQKDPSKGYNPTLRERMQAVLPGCQANNTRIVTNMGAANPMAAAHVMREEAEAMGLRLPTCAVVMGDEVTDLMRDMSHLRTLEDDKPLEEILPRMASANAYLGADAVRDALATSADIVVTGRVADPSLFLGPMLHHFGWDYSDWNKVAMGTLAGHLLECSGQVTGGCFADPGRKEVPLLAELGYPIAEISEDGSLIVTKTPGSGGRIDRATCTEQLIYEIHNPAAYITPDCVMDVTNVDFIQRAADRVEAVGAVARPRTDTYKVVVGYMDGYIGIGEMGYAGINAVARARLAANVVQDRLTLAGYTYSEMKVDLIGISSLHGEVGDRPEPYEVRLRIAARTNCRKAAAAVGAEVRGLHMQGPASAGGGYSLGVKEVLAVKSVLVPRQLCPTRIETVF
ncbi:acyclic terpene utilization AtuA family protein [Pseudomonas sp. NPDC088444]|uniref:acyclic terpene utilization AtuA family protein n=1 Tax=Pseudomonas sp. NPDC088444 TaxID=3364456 RepID=UPI003850BE31